MELISVKRIWDQGEHNAFTDLVLFQGALFCVFREGSAHVSPDGALRILRSLDAGGTWQRVSLLTSTQADLRDGKLIEFRGELLLLGGGLSTINQGYSPIFGAQRMACIGLKHRRSLIKAIGYGV